MVGWVVVILWWFPACFFSTSLRPFHAAWALQSTARNACPLWFSSENVCLQMIPTGQSYYSKRKRHNHDILMCSCIFIYIYICYTYNLLPFLVQVFFRSLYFWWIPAINLWPLTSSLKPPYKTSLARQDVAKEAEGIVQSLLAAKAWQK